MRLCAALLATACAPEPVAELDRPPAGRPGQATDSDSPGPLGGALAAYRWLAANAVERSEGLVWAPDPRESDRLRGTELIDLSLYHGLPGVVLFLTELEQATGELAGVRDRVARTASGARRALLAHLDDPDLEPGLYTGLAGIGSALLALDRARGGADGELEDEIDHVVARLAAAAAESDAGVRWNDTTDVVSGSAGIGFFLLAAREHLIANRPESAATALRLARGAGSDLLARALPAEGGLRWDLSPGFARNLPNFSHGTAGIAAFLARLYDASGERRFLDAALAGAGYLAAIADTTGDVCLIRHHDPGGEDLHYLSWCHGPAGTARLFYLLWQRTGDSSWREWMERSARGILESGIPERTTPGFWNNVGQCCGSAGVLDFFLSLFRVTGKETYLEFAERVAAQIRGRAEESHGGWRWTQAEHRVQPELLVAQTGYMQGAAGIGTALLRLHLVRAGRDLASRLPDAPF